MTPPPGLLARIVREPLLHFVLAGAAIFGVYAAVRKPAPPDPTGRAIRITAGDLEQLRRGWFSQWQRMPSPAELQDLIALRVREEVLSREALKLGLDRDDVIVRRRLAQKFDFLTQDLIPVREPSDVELTAYLDAHADRYQTRTLMNFSQVYFSPERRPSSEEEAREALRALRAGGDPRSIGDPTLLESEVRDETQDQVSRQFGGAFATAVLDLEPGIWSGPVRSTYGWHLVRAVSRSSGKAPPLAEVRSAVARDWAGDQRRAANDDLIRRLQGRYQITIEPGLAASESDSGPKEAKR